MGIFSFTIVKKTKLEQYSLEKESLQSQISLAAEFIREIEKGNLEAEYQKDEHHAITNENDHLADSLVNLRDQMVKVSLEEKQRSWVAQNRSEFIDILRSGENDLNEISEAIIRSLVKCLSANQGGLFIINDENPDDTFIELVSCYAYERKKFLSKRIEIGEGLIGQTILEKESVYLTEIPENYLSITSGLGEATPRHLLIVPLKLEENVFGAVEIASFREIKDYEIEFAEQLGESIASTIANVKNNQRTKTLLEATQQQAEEMRAQEEEVRQNMEELSATQEEMQRVMKELQGNEAYVKGLIDSTNDSILAIDKNYQIISCNKATQDTYKSSGMKITKGFDIFQVFSHEQKDLYKGYYDRALNGEFFEVTENYKFEGRSQYFLVSFCPLRDEAGEIYGVASFGKDITETVKAKESAENLLKESQNQAEEMRAQEEELRQNMEEISATQDEMQRVMKELEGNEAFVKGLIDSTNDSILAVDREYKLISWNKTMDETYKGSGMELYKGFDMFQLFSAEQKEVYRGYYDRALGGEFFEVTESYKYEGKEQFFVVTFSPLRNEENEIYGLACFGKDVTETVLAKQKAESLLEESQSQAEEMRAQEEELRQNMEELSATQEEMHRLMKETEASEAFIKGMMDSTNDSILAVDKEYKLLSWNKTMHDTYKSSGMELTKGFDIFQLFSPEQQELYKGYYDRALSGEFFEVTESYNFEGRDQYFVVTFSPLRNEEDEIYGLACFGKDVTETVKAKENAENLLKESQSQAEELKAQEEELRQNMEEISATQDEMQRIMQEVEGNEAFMKGIIDATNDTIFTVNKDYELLIFNETFRQTWEAQGFEVKKGVKLSVFYSDPKEWEYHVELINKALSGNQFSINISKEIGDQKFIFDITYSPVKGQDGETTAVAVFGKNITETEEAKLKNAMLLEESQLQAEELKAQEEELRQNMESLSATQSDMERVMKEVQDNEHYLNELINITQDAIYTISRDHRIISFNQHFQAVAQQYGIQIEKGSDYLSMFPSEKERRDHKKIIKKVFSGETVQLSLDYDGEIEVHLINTYSPIKNREGKIIAAGIFSKDVTEVVLAKKLLNNQEK